MASDGGLRHLIVERLQRTPRPLSAIDIARQLPSQFNKSLVNRVLYKLEREGSTQRSDSQPPRWSLISVPESERGKEKYRVDGRTRPRGGKRGTSGYNGTNPTVPSAVSVFSSNTSHDSHYNNDETTKRDYQNHHHQQNTSQSPGLERGFPNFKAGEVLPTQKVLKDDEIRSDIIDYLESCHGPVGSEQIAGALSIVGIDYFDKILHRMQQQGMIDQTPSGFWYSLQDCDMKDSDPMLSNVETLEKVDPNVTQSTSDPESKLHDFDFAMEKTLTINDSNDDATQISDKTKLDENSFGSTAFVSNHEDRFCTKQNNVQFMDSSESVSDSVTPKLESSEIDTSEHQSNSSILTNNHDEIYGCVSNNEPNDITFPNIKEKMFSVSQYLSTEDKVLTSLAQLPKYLSEVKELAHKCGYPSKKSINPTLYKLEEKQLVKKINNVPPVWELTEKGLKKVGEIFKGLCGAPVASTAADHSTSCNYPSAQAMESSNSEMQHMDIKTVNPNKVANDLFIQKSVPRKVNTKPFSQLKLQKSVNPSTSISQKTFQSNSSIIKSINTESFAALNKNPISALMEYAQFRKTTATIEELEQTGPPHNPRFKMAVKVDEQWFPFVICKNKKDGKREAADVALRLLISEGQYHALSTIQNPMQSLLETSQEPTHFDRVAGLSHHMFNSLVTTVPDALSGRKILAAIVMQCGDEGRVISLGTGNRCITGDCMSLQGKTVNDSHAEIIARRGFLRYVYRNLLTFKPGSDQSLFLASDPRNLFKVKPHITFHLYISTAPCGDGALFSPRDVAANVFPPTQDYTHHPTFSNAKQGVLRTKMEGGEGTIPLEETVKQTFDGIQRGERLRTMSCSDKICRWNILGMQGALLSHFVEPIYLDSLTLGLLYDHGHLSRAVCCRLEHGNFNLAEQVPNSYRINHPRLGRVTICDAQRETEKTKSISLNWCEGDEKPELIDGSQGVVPEGSGRGGISQVCKYKLYELFKLLCTHYEHHDLLACRYYNEAKLKSKAFQRTKQLMVQKFKMDGMSTWVTKPVEEKMF